MLPIGLQSLSFILTIIVYIINSESCIRSYPDHIIEYIPNNIGIDPYIHNLGNKLSFTECQNSCINFNYLCIASTDVIYGNTAGWWQLDDSSCELTAHTPTNSLFSWIAPITHDLVSTQYWIEMELTLTAGVVAGLFWKATYDAKGKWLRDYYFGFNADENAPVVGYSDPSTAILKKETLLSNTEYNTRHNLSIYYNIDTFTVYFDGEQFYNGTVDTSRYTDAYIAVYSFADVIYHSLYVQFPNNKDEMFCSAFVYKQDDGSCYGYYGDDYTTIETSLAAQSVYDAGIRYDSITCSLETTASPLTTSAPDASTFKPFLSTTNTVSSSLSLTTSAEATTSAPLTTLVTTSTAITTLAPLTSSSSLLTTSSSLSIATLLPLTTSYDPYSSTLEIEFNEREIEDKVMTTAKDEEIVNSKHKASPSDEIYIVVIGLVLSIIFVVFITVYNYVKYKAFYKAQKELNRNGKISVNIQQAESSNAVQLEQAQSDSNHGKKAEFTITVEGGTDSNNVINTDAVMKGSVLITRGHRIKEKVIKINEGDDDLWNNDRFDGEQETNTSTFNQN